MTNSPLLYDVSLPGLTAADLDGSWNVVCQRPALEPFWAEATHLQLHGDSFLLQGPGGLPQTGTWHLQRHQQLGQPFLVFNASLTATPALITRLRRSPDGVVRQMVLYFQSGLELELTHP